MAMLTELMVNINTRLRLRHQTSAVVRNVIGAQISSWDVHFFTRLIGLRLEGQYEVLYVSLPECCFIEPYDNAYDP